MKWKKPQEGVWIDALCINQDDKAEKVKAIVSMDLVYKCARLVIVALEIAGDEFELVKRLQGPDYLSSKEQIHRVDDRSFKAGSSVNRSLSFHIFSLTCSRFSAQYLMASPLVSLPIELFQRVVELLSIEDARDLLSTCSNPYGNGKHLLDKKCFGVLPVNLSEESLLQSPPVLLAPSGNIFVITMPSTGVHLCPCTFCSAKKARC